MINDRSKLIYLLGAGRSGTTLLTIMLSAYENITSLGEMHQFLEHSNQKRLCACGATLSRCEFWSRIENDWECNDVSSIKLEERFRKLENHSRIPLALLGIKSNSEYLNYHEKLLTQISQLEDNNWLLDSSKYIARYLMLRASKKISLKGIYMVRDVRGVIHSFGKKVQTRRSPLNAIMYYSAINFFGQLVCWTDKRIIKIRYEDLMCHPEITMQKIYDHIFEEDAEMPPLVETYRMPHIIGGNRMKSSQEVKIIYDQAWKRSMKRVQQIGYAILVFPFMFINSYNW
jgi:hypothetical protein